jgi:hypothetical protein
MPARYCLFALLASCLLHLPLLAQDEVATAIQRTLERHAATVVPIDVKVSVEIQGRVQEMDNQILGTVVDSTGLVIAAKGAIAPEPPDPRMREQIKIRPVSIHLVFDGGKTRRLARIAHEDSALSLVFLQIEDTKGLKLSGLDMSQVAAPKLGDRIYGPARLDAGFGHAPFVSLKRVTGQITQPRKAWLTAGEGVPGLPSFNAAGQLVGMHIPLTPPVAPRDLASGGDGTRTFLVAPSALSAALKTARASAAALRAALSEAAPANSGAPKGSPDAKKPQSKSETPAKKEGENK